MAENTYVVYNENKEACIIDPGCFTRMEKEELERFIKRNELTVKLILLTHAHLDHIFGLKWASEKWQITPHMHPSEKPVLERGPQIGLMYGLHFDAYNGPTLPLIDSNTIFLGNDALNVIFAPGHSPGHVCFYCSLQHFVIGGDVLFQGSIGRTDLPGGNFETLINSIKTRLFVLPEPTIVYCGHGPETTIGEEKQYNPFLT